MEASYNYQALTHPPQGEGWCQQNFNQQDFCEGAKELNSLHPVSSLPSNFNNSSYNEWMELPETLGCHEFDAFNDVLLPETKDLGPDLFGGLENSVIVPDIFDTELNANCDHYGTDEKFISHSEFAASNERPKFTTIKLKKVKVPKKRKLPQNDFKVCDYEVVSSATEPEVVSFLGQEMDITDSLVSFSDNNNELMKIYYSNNYNDYSFKDDEIKKLLSDDDSDMSNCLKEIEDEIINSADVLPNLTLKEAISMENADIILDAYLSPERSSFSLGSPQEQSVNLSFQEEHLFSPGSSSPSSYYESIPSPSSSLNDSMYDINLTAEAEILSNTGLAISSPKSEKKEQIRKVRKTRQKITAESRYLRKKEQNKQAALRYRAKKKLEDEQLMQTLKEEEDRNSKLKKSRKNLNQELKFMKKLLKESLIARNLVPPNAYQ